MPSNLMQRSATWLGSKLQDAAGTTVTYRRADKSISVTATHALAEHDIIDTEGFATKVKSHDWTFTAAELLLFAEQLTPRPGDRIEAGDDVYEVLPLDDKKPCVEPLDADGILVVVHTKKVA